MIDLRVRGAERKSHFDVVAGAWRLASIVTAKGPAYDVVLADEAGRERRYTFTTSPVPWNDSMCMFHSNDFGDETLFDALSSDAVMAAVVAFHAAQT